MAIIESCCCFRTVRKGSFASAIYTMIYDCIAIIITSIFVHEERNYFFGNATQPKSTTLIEPDTISPTTMTYNILLLVGCCCGLISSLLLIYGLIKDNRIFLIPWIVTVLVKTIIDVSHSFYLAILAASRLHPIHIILFTLDFFLLVLTIYAFLCVVSQYQEYKAGRGRAADEALRYGVANMPPPTATSCLSTRKPGTYHETTATATEIPSTVVTNDYTGSSPFHPPKRSPPPRPNTFSLAFPQRRSNPTGTTSVDGSNFKLEQSISESTKKQYENTPEREIFSPLNCDSSSKKVFTRDKRRPSSANRNSYYNNSPQWQGNNHFWKSPTPLNSQQENSSVPISQFYHPSMLENPWEELEKNLK